MHHSERTALCEVKCTHTCACGAVFEVVATRQEILERIETFHCPVCAADHTTKTCLPPRVRLIIAPAAKMPLQTPARPTA